MDRHAVLPGTKNVYIGDRGYCSYNNMAHVIEGGQYFLFRAKDIDKASSFDFIEYGSDKIYALTFRVVRFALSEGSSPTTSRKS